MTRETKFIFILFIFITIFSYSSKAVVVDGRWKDVLKAIAHVESKSKNKTVSKCGNYVGFLQISKVVVDDCNRIVGKKKYKYNHRLDKAKSIEMFYIIQNYYNPDSDLEKAIRIWNGGPKFSKKKTERYFKAVMDTIVK